MSPRLTLLAACLLALAVAVPGIAIAKPKHKAPLVPKTGEYTGTEIVKGEEEPIKGEVLKSGGKYSFYLVAEALGHCAAGYELPLTFNSDSPVKEGKFKGGGTVFSMDTEVTVKVIGHFKSPTELVGTASSSTKAEPAEPQVSECSTGNVKFTLKKG
jgi:hypothetical protein